MLLIVACVLFVMWLLGKIVFKMTSGLIHLILVIAIIVVVVHFLGGS
jgi:hypothetical protein